ncbi:MAG: tRNA lysidine(34) synthetase TilS [Polyangiaceae bacterium]
MSRSHPPTLITLVKRALPRAGRGATIVAAVSGGPDSQALLHALALLRERFELRLFARSVDHGLRPEAREEIALARALARQLDVPHSVGRLTVAAGGNLMARARTARYEDLESERYRRKADFIATAHHADDRAETVLLRLLRGASVQGLGVLPVVSGCLLRPMIRARRHDVEAHLRRHHLAFARDPSNQDRRFLRVRVRHELMPLLLELSPAIVGHLNALADSAIEPAPRILDEGGIPLTLSRPHRQALAALLDQRSPRGRVLLPGGRVARWAGSGIVVESRQGAAKPRKSD